MDALFEPVDQSESVQSHKVLPAKLRSDVALVSRRRDCPSGVRFFRPKPLTYLLLRRGQLCLEEGAIAKHAVHDNPQLPGKRNLVLFLSGMAYQSGSPTLERACLDRLVRMNLAAL